MRADNDPLGGPVAVLVRVAVAGTGGRPPKRALALCGGGASPDARRRVLSVDFVRSRGVAGARMLNEERVFALVGAPVEDAWVVWDILFMCPEAVDDVCG